MIPELRITEVEVLRRNYETAYNENSYYDPIEVVTIKASDFDLLTQQLIQSYALIDSLKAEKEKRKPIVDWGFSCGRAFLEVCGTVVAVEGDMNRSTDFQEKQWTTESIKKIAEKANKTT